MSLIVKQPRNFTLFMMYQRQVQDIYKIWSFSRNNIETNKIFV